MVRFEGKCEPETGSASVALSQIAQACLDQEGSDAVGIVVTGETAGLVGTALRRSPVGMPGGVDRFRTPRSATGSRSRRSPNMPAAPRWSSAWRPAAQVPPLAPFVRPLSGSRCLQLQGHFHAAVVPYRPLPGGSLELAPTVSAPVRAGPGRNDPTPAGRLAADRRRRREQLHARGLLGTSR